VRAKKPKVNFDASLKKFLGFDRKVTGKVTSNSTNKVIDWLLPRLGLFLAIITLVLLSVIIGGIRANPWIVILVLASSVGVPTIMKRDGENRDRLLGIGLGFAFIIILGGILSGFEWSNLWWVAVCGISLLWMIVPKAFLSIFFLGALTGSIIAICQQPLHGTPSHLLATATIIWFAYMRSNWFRFIGLVVGLVCLIKAGSFTLAGVTSVVCCVLLATNSQWGECSLALAITIVCLISPLALSQNRIIRLAEYILEGDKPFQTEQAQACLRELRYIGTSPGIRNHLPGAADDMSLLNFMLWGGSCVGSFLIACHAVVVTCMWFIIRRTEQWRRNIGIAVIYFYAIVLLLHTLSNLTLIPSIGLSAPLQGRGLTNIAIGLLLVWFVSSAPRVDRDATEHFSSDSRLMALLILVTITLCYIVVGAAPWWATILFSK